MPLSSNNRILVIDDDEITLALVTYRLSKEGFLVDQARDGVSAVEKLRDTEYAVILLDILMPRLDGFGVLQFINEERPHLRPQVIIMTALADEHSPVLEGTFKMVHKPIDYSMLTPLIRQCVAQLAQSPSWYSPDSPGRF